MAPRISENSGNLEWWILDRRGGSQVSEPMADLKNAHTHFLGSFQMFSNEYILII